MSLFFYSTVISEEIIYVLLLLCAATRISPFKINIQLHFLPQVLVYNTAL